ncbi:hypothetical protein [Neisseria sp. CCUG12390]|uniref:hypothetical protein n=1 Tax=Neisseria sp. CCUG12390 TaxID=3392035 RepID=UPI003A10069D
MKHLTILLTAALSLVGMSACGHSSEEQNMSIQERTEQRFRQNPNPKEAYRIRIKINDAPGPLKLMSDMDVGYLADNCEYLITSEIIGAKAHPEKSLRFPIHKISESEYETVVYRDAMLDEDYFGDGVCRWRIAGFGTGFKATGKPEETRFSFGDMVDELIERKTMTSYYWKRDYPYTKKDDGSIYEDSVHFAIRSPELLNPEEFKNLFSITATIEEVK